ncbi:MAG: hypothetical protein RLZZ200_2575 [Pseudomonadota bacterium]
MLNPIQSARDPQPAPRLSVVVIGRNEGERLMACLRSVLAMDFPREQTEVIYVDSGSTDGSALRASGLGATVIEVRPERPSAALGRNAGWRAARGQFVLFLDGDTLLAPGFVNRALQEFAASDVAIVWGHRREIDPGQSVYVRVLDLDWVYAPGETAFCGGDALMRREVLEAVGGFDDTLIAGEEPEMCRRIRAAGWRIQHIDAPMTGHDLAVRSFKAWWRRAFRAGHAYAEVSARFRDSADNLWQSEVRRNLIHGSGLVAVGLLVLSTPFMPAAVALGILLGVVLATLAVLARTAARCAWKSDDRVTTWLYAIHSHLQQVPILVGQLSQRLDALSGRRRRLIEYKSTGNP